MCKVILKIIAAVGLYFVLSTPVLAFPAGGKLPQISQLDQAGNALSPELFAGKIVVFEWINIKCPFVQEQYTSGSMARYQKEVKQGGNVLWITVDSTNPEHANFVEAAAVSGYQKEHGVVADHLIKDRDGALGRMLGAKTTPHMFVFASDGTLAYQGAIDSQPELGIDRSKEQSFVSKAVSELKKGAPIDVSEQAPYGCSVKY